jgi:hypothetical protein
MDSKMPPKKSGSSDHFQTDPSDVRFMSQFLPKEWVIWENACGQGKIVSTLKEDGFEVIGTDVMQGFDFISPLIPPPENFDCIFTNPPYSIKDEWLQRCYDIGKPFALLMPITALGEQERVKMYNKYGVDVLLPPARINFGTPSGEGSGSWFYAAWFCKGIPFPEENKIGNIYGGG